MNTQEEVRREERCDASAIACAARSYHYQLMQRLMGSEPTEDLIRELISDQGATRLSLLLAPQAYVEASSALETVSERFRSAPEDFMDRACGAYTRCFLGPGSLPSPPWESMHVGADKTLFNEATLEVRRFYAQAGFRPCAYPRVADDHVAIELDFMAQLARETERSLDVGDFGRMCELIGLQRVFLDEHLGHWVGAFAQGLEAEDRAFPYSCVVKVLKLFVEADAALLVEIEHEALRIFERNDHEEQ